MATKSAAVFSPLCALIVEGDPNTRKQGTSNSCIGASLLLAELGVPFELAGFVKRSEDEEDEVRVLVEEHFPTIVSSLTQTTLPLLIYTPDGTIYSGPAAITKFIKNLPEEVARMVDKSKLESLARDVEKRIGELELGDIEEDGNKIMSDVHKIIAHGQGEKELPSWIDLIRVLKGLESHLEALAEHHPSASPFLNTSNPAMPSPRDCYLAPILNYAEVALSTLKKWDMVRDHKFTHLRRYLDSWLSRPSWKSAQVSDKIIVDRLIEEHEVALSPTTEEDYRRVRVQGSLAGTTAGEQMQKGVAQSG